MRHNKYQKFIAGVLLTAQILFLPLVSYGQGLLGGSVGSAAVGALNPVPINDSGSVAGNAGFNADFTIIKTTFDTCTGVVKAFDATDNAAALGMSFSAIIGGSGALSGALAEEAVAYQKYLDCLQGPPGSELTSGASSAVGVGAISGVLPSLSALVAPNSYTGTIKQQMVSQVSAAVETYKAKLTTARARYDVATQDVWKAFLITTLLNLSKSVADQLVNKLVSNYKIANFKKYIDSTATLMYDNQFIRDNFPDQYDQLMARQVLTNPLVRTQIQPAVYLAANTALNTAIGSDPGSVDVNDPTFYTKMAMVGSSAFSPYFKQTGLVAGVDQARAQSVNTAQQQISQGSGYKAPVNCAGSLAQQKQIDLANKAAQDQLANRQGLLTSLQQAQAAGQTVSASDLAKAQADLTAAQAAWNKLPFSVTGANSVSGSTADGGSTAVGTTAITICEAISSPAVLVNQGIDAMFKNLSDNMSQYNSNNLPSFLKQLSGIATQIGSSLILGGGKNASTILENGLNGGIAAVTSAGLLSASQNATDNLAKGVQFDDPVPNTDVPNSYTLTWNVNTDVVPSASYVTITGTGVPATKPGLGNGTVPNKFTLSGSLAVTAPSGTNYTLNVYNSTGALLVTAVQTIIAPPGSSLSSFTGPCPAGQTVTPTGCVSSSSPPPAILAGIPVTAVCTTSNFGTPQNPGTWGTCMNATNNDSAYCQVACAPDVSKVNGAFTSVPAPLYTRGLMSQLMPRGQ